MQSLGPLRVKGGSGENWQGKWHGQSGPHPQYWSWGALTLVMFAGLPMQVIRGLAFSGGQPSQGQDPGQCTPDPQPEVQKGS